MIMTLLLHFLLINPLMGRGIDSYIPQSEYKEEDLNCISTLRFPIPTCYS